MFFKNKNNVEEEDLKRAVANLKKGSAEAFHILYSKYSQRVYRFCLRMLGDEEQARDAFQDTFVKVHENRKNFRGENFSAWVFTIARHTCLNMIRARKDHEEFDEVFHSKSSARVADVGMKEQIEKAIAMLPIALKEAFILREYEECSYQEIADILDIDLSLSKVRVHRARILLRKLLKPLIRELNES